MLPLYGFLVLIYHATTGLTAPATYDQRQSGDLNVQVHLNDVQVLALLDKELLDDYTEYDYFYDYADFTVKPGNGETSVKPTPISETSSSSSGTTVESETVAWVEPETVGSVDVAQNSTLSSSSESPVLNSTVESTSAIGSEKPNESSTEKTGDNIIENVKTRRVYAYNSEDHHSELSSQGNSTKPMRKRCRSGYLPDGKGRCRRLSQRRLSLIPIAMKLGPRFLDNLTHNTKNQP